MENETHQLRNAENRLANGWRIAGWAALLALLALPAVAMRFTEDVQWSGADFVVGGMLLGLLGGGIELAFRLGRNKRHHAAIALFTIAAFLTIWANLAVGIIGNEATEVNQGFTIATIAAATAAILLRFRSSIMRWLCLALAAIQPLLGLAALRLLPGHEVEWGVLGFFAFVWSLAGLLFHRSQKR